MGGFPGEEVRKEIFNQGGRFVTGAMPWLAL